MRIKRIRGRERGLAFVWTMLAMSAIMGMAAWGVDVNMWYSRKGAMQTATDAAALAGAYTYAHSFKTLEADKLAEAAGVVNTYLNANGFPVTGTTAVSITMAADGHPNWYRVQLKFTQPTYFAAAFGKGHQDLRTTATAQFIGKVPSPIDSAFLGIAPFVQCAQNGTNTTPYNYELFGIYADHANGDDEGVAYQNVLNSYGDYRNVKHVSSAGFQAGYPNWPGKDFTIQVPQTWANANNQMEVELWDPDTYNAGGAAGPSNTLFDEIRSSGSHSSVQESNKPDTTIFKLVWTDQSGKDTVLGTAQYDGNSWWSDGYGYNKSNPADTSTVYGHMKTTTAPLPTSPSTVGWGWVTPQSGWGLMSGTFVVDPAKYVTGGRLHLLVTTTDGSSENGYSVRAGPVHATDGTFGISTMDDCTWNSKYSISDPTQGIQILANGTIPLNFDQNGTAQKIPLGYVPPNAAGGTFTISRFDTDIAGNGLLGANYYYYPDTNPSSKVSPTVITTAPTSRPFSSLMVLQGPWGRNDEEDTDTVYLPPDYPGGNWYMDYSAGSADTSQWHLNVSGGEIISLVGEGGQLY